MSRPRPARARSGEVTLIGEIACIALALIVAPAWLTLLRQGDVKRETQGG